MTPFLSFLLRANLALVLLYGFYFLCFRRDTFFGYIRWYLLVSVLSAVIFPLIDISAWLTGNSTAMEVSQYIPDAGVIYQSVFAHLQIEPAVEPIAVRMVPWDLILPGCWLAVVVLMFGKRLFQLACIIRLWRRYPRKHYGKTVLVAVDRNMQPFSFFGHIFLNPAHYAKDDLDEIVAHEQVHCRQGHTFDILLAEMLVCLDWFNPVAWLFRYDLKQNIEFYTDRMTLHSGFNRKHYQYSLLRVSDSSLQIANHFYFNNLKKRIIMMNKKESPRILSAKYLLVVPALAAALLTVQISGLQARKTNDMVGIIENPVRVEVTEQNVESNITAKQGIEKPQKPATIVPVANIDRQHADSIKRGNSSNIFKSEGNFSGEQLIIVLDGKKIISQKEMHNIDPNDIESINIVKDKTTKVLYGDKVGNVAIMLITTKKGMLTDKLHQVAAEKEPHFYFSLTDTNAISPKYTTCMLRVSGSVSAGDGQLLPGVAIVVKGGTAGTVTDQNGNYALEVPSNAVLQFSYIGMATLEIAVANRQEINVIMRSETQSNDVIDFKGKIMDIKNAPVLFIVDGKEVSNMNDLSPYDIESITVLKDQSAISMYGEKGKNGVVIITTKK